MNNAGNSVCQPEFWQFFTACGLNFPPRAKRAQKKGAASF
jgi:hypothetical protein